MWGNFSRHEFACRCGCGFDAVDVELLEVLQDVRDHFEAPVTVTSGCRCPTRNRAVGGERKSMHLNGMAADIVVEGVTPETVVNYLVTKYYTYGIGLYSDWVHIDVRDAKARW